MLSLLIWIIVGAFAGWLASIIMNTDAHQGPIADIITGMIGSLIGGFIVTLITKGDVSFSTAYTNLNFVSILVSVLGAVVLLWTVKQFNKRTA